MEDSDQLQFDPRELEKLTPADSREIQQFLQNENQKTQVQRSVHELTETCFKKCIASGSISGGKLASKEESCVSNCVERFMDSNLAVLKHLETLRAGQ